MDKKTKLLMTALSCFLLSTFALADDKDDLPTVDPCGYGCPKEGCPNCPPPGGPIGRFTAESNNNGMGSMVTVSGKLQRIVAIGGETAGWGIIKVDSDLEITKGKRVKQIEIDPNGKTIDALEGKRVKVTGSLIWRHGVERGNYPVIMIDTIKGN